MYNKGVYVQVRVSFGCFAILLLYLVDLFSFMTCVFGLFGGFPVRDRYCCLISFFVRQCAVLS